MKALELPCDANPHDLLTLARVGGCAAVTAKGQVNLTPARARQAGEWLIACAVEVEASLATVRAERAAEESPACQYCHRHNCDCCTGPYRCCDPEDRCRRHQ